MSITFWNVSGWKAHDLPITTNSDEAAKLLHSGITQLVSWREDELGIEQTTAKLIEADPEFILGRVFVLGLTLMGSGDSGRKSPLILREISELRKLSSNITKRELLHLEAVALLAEGKLLSACSVLEDLLVVYPTDMLAIKLAHDAYFYLGRQKDMLDSIERVFPKWSKDLPLWSYLHGMHAFALCETGSYEKARQSALKGLELNRNDGWSTHANAHVLEMTSKSDEGIAFLSRTVADWQPCGLLSCHNFWHWAIFHIENGETEAAIDLFDSEIGLKSKSGVMLDYVDGASLLYRLELEGVNVAERWKPLLDVTQQHFEDHILFFNDAHFAMLLLGLKNDDYFNKFQDSINSVEDLADVDYCRVTNLFGKKLIHAMRSYGSGDYDECTSSMLQIKPQLVQMGGSDAQRDVFELLLINSAIKSQSYRDKAKELLDLRASLRRQSPMCNRLRARLQRHD